MALDFCPESLVILHSGFELDDTGAHLVRLGHTPPFAEYDAIACDFERLARVSGQPLADLWCSSSQSQNL